MINRTNVTRSWHRLYGNLQTCVNLVGYYPSTFDWTIKNLKGNNPYKGVRLIVESTGRYPSVLAGCVPFPVVGESAMKVLKEDFCITNFVRIRCGKITDGRYVHRHHYSIPVFRADSCYNAPQEVPTESHWAIINGLFSIDSFFVEKYSNNLFDDVIFSKVGEEENGDGIYAKNFDEFFVEHSNANMAEIEEKVFQYIKNATQKFYREKGEKISAILLDVDPPYGYVILTVKTSPVRGSYKGIDIDNFEYENYSCIEGSELYGTAKYLKEKYLVKVLTSVLNRLVVCERIKNLASGSGLHLAYAIHDKPIRWIAKVSGKYQSKD